MQNTPAVTTQTPEKEAMRLDRFLCEAAMLTRSNAKKLLHRGLVEVDGIVIKKGDLHITNQKVTLEGQTLSLRPPVYVMLNKPTGYISSTQSEDWPSLLTLLPQAYQQGVHIAGRLDVDTTGLVLITDDGQWSHRLSSPRKEQGKTYRVTLAEPVMDTAIEQFAQGVMLNGETKPTKPATLELLTPTDVRLTLHEGRYHQVKRMFASIGNRVTALHREKIGSITLDAHLEPGQWRALTSDEINSLD